MYKYIPRSRWIDNITPLRLWWAFQKVFVDGASCAHSLVFPPAPVLNGRTHTQVHLLRSHVQCATEKRTDYVRARKIVCVPPTVGIRYITCVLSLMELYDTNENYTILIRTMKIIAQKWNEFFIVWNSRVLISITFAIGTIRIYKMVWFVVLLD